MNTAGSTPAGQLDQLKLTPGTWRVTLCNSFVVIVVWRAKAWQASPLLKWIAVQWDHYYMTYSRLRTYIRYIASGDTAIDRRLCMALRYRYLPATRQMQHGLAHVC